MNQFIKLGSCQRLVQKYGNSIVKNYKKYGTRSSSYFMVQEVPRIYLQPGFFSLYSVCQIREFAKKAQAKMMKGGGKTKLVQLTDEEMSEVIDIEDYRDQLYIVAEKLKKEYVENLSTRSAAGNIDKLTVKIDNEDHPLNELAVISKKNPNLIAINMTDFPEGLKPTIQAIIDSGACLNPQQEGTMIYVSVPKLTREHRENLAKNAKSLFVKAKDVVRSIQNSFVKEAKGRAELSEDLVFNAVNQIMAIAEHCSSDLEKIMKTKQKELLGDS